MNRLLTVLSVSILFLLISPLTSHGKELLNLLENVDSKFTIRIAKNADAEEKLAAETFQQIFLNISGKELKIKKGLKNKRSIIIAKNSRLEKHRIKRDLKDDGFALVTEGKNLLITGGREKGVIYGVYAFFEKFAGCRWLTDKVIIYPPHKDLKLDVVNIVEVPAFSFRQVHYRHTFDPIFRQAHKLDMFNEDWGMWVHTFFSLLSPKDYFEEHPEYFAEVNGKRTQHTQLCLSNPEVLEIVCERLKEKIGEMPAAKYWSVSQMDTQGFCTCKDCKAIDEEEGSPSGTIIRFVNKVAESFPEKIISTLAYQYSRKPPLISKPAENVNIMFCSK